MHAHARQSCGAGGCAHHLAQEHDVLAADHIEPQWHVCKLLFVDDALHSLLEHNVGELIERAQQTNDLAPVTQLHEHAL